jgi:hypothetical protein
VHPYVSVLSHSERNLRRLLAALPAQRAGRQVWFTEVGALYCTRGELRGEARQANDAAYLVDSLLADPTVAPEHVFYYGFLFGWRSQAPCSPAGGQDSELYTSAEHERAAARVIFSAAATRPPTQAVSSQPPPAALGWPPWNAAASLMIGPVPDAPSTS